MRWGTPGAVFQRLFGPIAEDPARCLCSASLIQDVARGASRAAALNRAALTSRATCKCIEHGQQRRLHTAVPKKAAYWAIRAAWSREKRRIVAGDAMAVLENDNQRSAPRTVKKRLMSTRSLPAVARARARVMPCDAVERLAGGPGRTLSRRTADRTSNRSFARSCSPGRVRPV
jgi:hypothetical protein